MDETVPASNKVPVMVSFDERLFAAVVAWLDENARRCGHGCIHVTCGDCCPVRPQ